MRQSPSCTPEEAPSGSTPEDQALGPPLSEMGDGDWGSLTHSQLDLGRYIPALLTFASNRLSHGASETYRRLFGVGISEWRVISLLATEPDISAARMCQVIGFDKSLASRVVKKLSEQGMISSSPDGSHGKRWLVRLTREGERLHDKVLHVVKERERILHEAFSADEIDTLVSLLHRVHEQATVVNAYQPRFDQAGATYRVTSRKGA